MPESFFGPDVSDWFLIKICWGFDFAVFFATIYLAKLKS
jgi:hypothetical protein